MRKTAPKHRTCTVSSLATLVAMGIISPLALADGAIEGRISDQSGKVFFDGAIVSINGTPLETRSDDGGRFRFKSVPAGTHTLTVSYIGTEPVSTQVTVVDGQTARETIGIGDEIRQIENVIVIGQRAGAFRALNQMRAADNLISVVTADSIGQFPDENVSEALQRVTGVFIERDQGEGRFVGVRGIDPNLNVAQINGLNVPAPESDRRNVALDVIPSDLVESLEVTKTLTPDQDGDSIGGTINIKSLTAFDREDMSFKINAHGYYNDLEDDNGHKVSASFTNVFDLGEGELGVAFSASTNERNFGTDNVESDGGWSEEDGVRFQEEMELRDYIVTREREGYALNLDYRANEDHSYYLRSLYSKFSDQEFRNRIEFKLDEGDVAFTDTSLTATGTELQRELKDRYEEQEISSVMIGGENHINLWTLEYSVGYSEASEEEPGRIDSEFAYDEVASAGYNSIGEQPALVFSPDGADPSNFTLEEIVTEDNRTEDEETAFKLDIKREFTFNDGNNGYVKFGGKFRTREKTNDVNARIFEDFGDAFGDDVLLSDFVSGNTDFTLGNYGPFISSDLQRNFVNSNIAGNAACQLATYDEDACPFIMDEDGTRLDSARDYTVEEDVTALYAMSRLDFDTWRVVFGLRWEQTDVESNGFLVREVDVDGQDDVQIEPVRFKDDYSHVLPSVNIRVKPTDNLIVRAAYTQSIARPSFGQITPTADAIEIEDNDGDIELAVEAGNPNLEPYESQNLDFAVEYYDEALGVFSAGVFYKDIDNFIFNADVSSVVDPAQFSGNIPVTDIEVFQPLNGATAELYGLELSWSRQFSGALDGFLFMVNATFTDSDADLGLPADAERSNESELPLQADSIANVVLGYEKYGLSLRLSSAYISERIAEINLEDESNDLLEDAHHQIDFTAKYDINENFQVFFNAININEESNYRYFGERRFNGQYDEIGRSFALGVTYRNF